MSDFTSRNKDLQKGLTKVRDREEETGQAAGQDYGSVVKFKRDMADPIEYDVDALEAFLDIVFHDADDSAECNVLTWGTSSNIPGYPKAESDLFSTLRKSKKARALYFGTSTCRPDATDGKLYNRKTLFHKLHVIVLDDIGTKIPIDTLPEGLEPTYVIESSEGNYQYGFVLEQAIDIKEQAEALIQLVYESGYSDAGGKMATKLVRLPDGNNGKPGPKYNFRVNLVSSDGPYWTPDALLDILDTGVTWAEVEADAEEMIKRRASSTAGSSPWSPIPPKSQALNGIVDPVLEWLYDNDLVKQETDDWATIKCPWGHTHTDGDGTAGYSPIGRGEDFETRRAFHCFHDHCKDRTARDFLAYIATNGGPIAPVHDEAAKLVAGWVYDSASDCAWEIQDVDQPRNIAMAAFRNTFPRSVPIIKSDGKKSSVKEAQLWLTSPGRVTVQGQTFDPTTSAKIVERGRDLFVNMFYRPEWGEGPYDQKDVDKFKEFIAYLIPLEDEQKYFLHWLAAKAQNMGFRGAGILMIAKQQGTGRNTLSDMMAALFGRGNLENVPFKQLTGDSPYNEWMERPFVVVSETKDTSANASYYRAYESLKENIDPRPREERINPKYGRQRMSMVHSSYLMFSNHENALAVAGNDRRIYVIRNVLVPAEPEYFMEVNDWLQRRDKDGMPLWARSVWRWLQEQEINLVELLAPAPSTAAKESMVAASKSPLEMAVETAILGSGSDFTAIYKVKEALRPHGMRLKLNEVNNLDGQLRAIISHMSESTTTGTIVKIDGKTVRPRVTHVALCKPNYTAKFTQQEISKNDRATIRAELEGIDMKKLEEEITKALDLLES